MNGSTVSVVLGLVVIVLLTAVVCLLLSIPLLDDDTPPTTTRAIADVTAQLPPAVDRAMP